MAISNLVGIFMASCTKILYLLHHTTGHLYEDVRWYHIWCTAMIKSGSEKNIFNQSTYPRPIKQRFLLTAQTNGDKHYFYNRWRHFVLGSFDDGLSNDMAVRTNWPASLCQHLTNITTFDDNLPFDN